MRSLRKRRNASSAIATTALCMLFSSSADAATLFIDATLASDCATGDYSIGSRDCSGADGAGYRDLGDAITAMSPGDHLVLRGGTYVGCWQIPPGKNGTAWSAGNFNKMSSCGTEEGCSTNEWAILDGDYDCGSNGGAVLGNKVSTTTGSADLKYWWLERLEIKNGRSTSGTSGYGFNGNGGPFRIRHCYIHDNGGTPGTSSQCDDLPGGTSGQAWHDSVIEFNWYADNGGTAGNNNCKQITWIPSYELTDDVEQNGLTVTDGYMGNGTHVLDVNNVIRYNLVTGGHVGIGIKHFVWFTGRNPGNGAGYDDTYADLSVKIHHNIVRDAGSYGIGAHFDFAQVHNNIVDNAREGIRSMYDYWGSDSGYSYHYKNAIYNNTIVNPTSDVGYIGLGRRWADWIDERVFLYLFNNILDGCGDGPVGYCQDQAITAKLRCSNETRTVDYSNAHISHNYLFRPDEPTVYRVDQTTYTSDEFEAQSITPQPRVAYAADDDPANPLNLGTDGADKYLVHADHEVRAGVTVREGGIGGPHPYLAGVTLPSYLGAVNPDDDAWVGGVLERANLDSLRNSGSGEPAWVEGAGAAGAGGSAGSGGAAGSAGSGGAAGSAGSAGVGSGGAAGQGGSGGTPATGGTAGSAGTGGAGAAGGASGSGGSATGGMGAGAASNDDDGCGCAVPKSRPISTATFAFLMGALVAMRGRRRQRS